MTPVRISGAALFVATALLALMALACALIGEAVAAHARADAARAAGAFTVRVIAPEDESAPLRAANVLAGVAGVRFAVPVTRERAARLMESAGGGPVDPDTLPAVRLIEAARDPARATDADIDAALRRAGYRIEIFAAAPVKDDRAALAGAAGQGGALLALLLLALLLRLSAPATPAAVAADLGAPRPAVLAAYGRSGAAFGFIAGGLATLATIAGAAGVLSGGPDPVSLADMVARISPMEAAIVLLAPLAAALAASLGARAGAGGAYDAADRLG